MSPEPKSYFMSFQFLRLDPAYHKLLSNEKVVAKQEFLSVFDAMQLRMPIASYALTGLKSDCDVLFWRLSRRIEDLHAMSSGLQYAGLGKYLLTTKAYLGTVEGGRYAPKETLRGGGEEPPKVLGQKPYLIVQPMWKDTRGLLPQNDPSRTAHLHVADARGLDDPDHILAYETSDPLEFRGLAEAWKVGLDTSTYTCILAGIKEIVDSFG